ncbi:MAG: LmeA family phospholipid-binding protein [Fimbriimonadaceae bacterium]|nr:LmeA family phospholipid-binding protein [Fimbriimonadaceae bacterium]
MKSLRVGSLEAKFGRIELEFGLVVESFEVYGGESAADLNPFALYLKQPGTAKAVVTEQAIANLLTKQAPGGLKDFQVSISGGLIYVEAKAQIVVTIPVKAVCTLEIEDGKRLMVRLKQVDVMGGGAKNLVEGQLAKINPIFDAGDLPIDVRLETVEADAGQVVLHGIVVGV